jgi:hypothetical protein
MNRSNNNRNANRNNGQRIWVPNRNPEDRERPSPELMVILERLEREIRRLEDLFHPTTYNREE